MSATLSPTARNARAVALLAIIDAAVTPATLKIYTTPQPLAGAEVTTQTLLASFLLQAPSGSVTGPTLTFDDPDAVQVENNGEANWGRISDGDGNWVIDGNCGEALSGAFFILDNTLLLAGGTLSVTTGTLTEV